MDEPDLAGLDPFDLMAEEARQIEAFYAALPPDGWRAPTRCAGWDRRALLAHLAAVEDYTRAGLRGEVQQLIRAAGGGSLDDLNAWGVAQRDTLPHADLLAAWRDLVASNDAALRSRATETMDTTVGQYPVWRQAFYLASERAIHADDADVPVPESRVSHRLDWRLRFARVAVTENAQPGQVSVVADRGAQVVRLVEEECRLPDEQFVAAVSGRLPPEVDIPPRIRDALAVLV
ncbi:hypothetical protein Val02_83940 [Virgisporangium aliadipatigenens]|uniref:Mycothiol-dependent maleylpyruvate isomerase metal-binding domain-containing protein n=1 Tax=Virgisporangium aliadipatigenens TaxID=741659 RepID=A0A8J4DVT6_9ACTN|nr:maleylpyruvate isomerase family mycothiol-dependent enzyme [Virgisporangium aliadipatigenens]GIJ51508.1 hypothetical protein Val02_83940 [Virgisporangium aliadipatigenens]